MMYGSTSTGPWVWLHIHWLFWGIAVFGFFAGLLWLYKHASKKDFLSAVWLTLVAGILGGLLTAPVAFTGWNQMWEGHHSYGWNSSSWNDHHEEMWELMEDYWDDLDAAEDFDMEEMMDEMMDLDEEDNS